MNDQPSMEAVLIHYGADRVPESRGDGWRAMRCPFHDDSQASASVSDTGFNCHACGVKGDAIGLIMLQEELSFTEALKVAQTIDSDYTPGQSSRRSGGRRKTGRKWSPPGRRGRQPWA